MNLSQPFRSMLTAFAVATCMHLTVFAGSAKAETVEEFYTGKTVSLIIGYGPGGGYDSYARLLAQHMGRHMPGNPTIVPKNMPGAGSLVAANYLYNVAPDDGSEFGIFGRGIAMAPLLDGEGVEYDAIQFNWIGSLNNEVSTCVSWHSSPVGKWEDLKETELSVPSGGPGADDHLFASILRHVFDAKLRVIPGYSKSSEMLLAMARGEVGGFCGWSWSSAKSRKPEWIRDGQVNVLVQLALEKHPDLPDVPLVMDLAETEEQRQMLELIFARQAMGRPFAAPPNIPEERLSALRDAFEATVSDPEFLAEAMKANLEINPLSGSAFDELLQSIYQ
ncbi:MAG: Bug family tripartite tricarboxylate transporter substrate binding protein, partial [Geminicoccaceae bacterium]